MPDLSDVLVRQSDGAPIVEISWDRDLGKGRVNYLRENLKGFSVEVGTESFARNLLSKFAEKGCSFEVVQALEGDSEKR